MKIEERIELLVSLGNTLKTEGLTAQITRTAVNKNLWFTEQNIGSAIDSICRHYLDENLSLIHI